MFFDVVYFVVDVESYYLMYWLGFSLLVFYYFGYLF